MERRTLGKTGLQVSMLGFGGAELGFDDDVTDARAAAVLHPALDAGLNVIDTASAYLGSEQLLGRALVGKRDQVLLFSKCGATDGFSHFDWSKAVELALRFTVFPARGLDCDRRDFVTWPLGGECWFCGDGAVAGGGAAADSAALAGARCA